METRATKDAIDRLIASGDAYYDNKGALIGIASDGMHLLLTFASRDETLAYLAQHPTPDTW